MLMRNIKFLYPEMVFRTCAILHWLTQRHLQWVNTITPNSTLSKRLQWRPSVSIQPLLLPTRQFRKYTLSHIACAVSLGKLFRVNTRTPLKHLRTIEVTTMYLHRNREANVNYNAPGAGGSPDPITQRAKSMHQRSKTGLQCSHPPRGVSVRLNHEYGWVLVFYWDARRLEIDRKVVTREMYFLETSNLYLTTLLCVVALTTFLYLIKSTV